MRPAPEGHTHCLSHGWKVVAATVPVAVSSAALFYPSSACHAESKLLSIIPDVTRVNFQALCPMQQQNWAITRLAHDTAETEEQLHSWPEY